MAPGGTAAPQVRQEIGELTVTAGPGQGAGSVGSCPQPGQGGHGLVAEHRTQRMRPGQDHPQPVGGGAPASRAFLAATLAFRADRCLLRAAVSTGLAAVRPVTLAR
jgi:hypothetical protein